MNPLNPTATKTFQSIINRLNGSRHIKINNAPEAFMPLSVEFLYETTIASQPARIYSLSHYYQQFGDLVPDPDMTFAVLNSHPTHPEGPQRVFPLTYQDSFRYDEAVFPTEEGNWKQNPKLQASLTAFANLWLKNLKHQQNL